MAFLVVSGWKGWNTWAKFVFSDTSCGTSLCFPFSASNLLMSSVESWGGQFDVVCLASSPRLSRFFVKLVASARLLVPTYSWFCMWLKDNQRRFYHHRKWKRSAQTNAPYTLPWLEGKNVMVAMKLYHVVQYLTTCHAKSPPSRLGHFVFRQVVRLPFHIVDLSHYIMFHSAIWLVLCAPPMIWSHFSTFVVRIITQHSITFVHCCRHDQHVGIVCLIGKSIFDPNCPVYSRCILKVFFLWNGYGAVFYMELVMWAGREMKGEPGNPVDQLVPWSNRYLMYHIVASYSPASCCCSLFDLLSFGGLLDAIVAVNDCDSRGAMISNGRQIVAEVIEHNLLSE